MRAMTSLVTNDDGIDSPGLIAAVEAVRGLGRLVVVAPPTQQTSRGRGMIGNWDDHLKPARLQGRAQSIEAYHIDASPALAVQHAMNTIFFEAWPDLLVSGVNYGENLGMDVTISGTVGAALQGATYGIPAIAVSQESDIAHHYEYGEMDWSDSTRVLREYASRMAERIAAAPPPMEPAGPRRLSSPKPFPFDILKIDVPRPCPPETPERICRLSRRHYYRHTIENPTPTSILGDGRTWVDEDRNLIEEGTDIYAFAIERAVALTPLTVDFSADTVASAKSLGIS